jgi:8-oxo-dGTP pyrophosphatase MutT (NUDIX family)
MSRRQAVEETSAGGVVFRRSGGGMNVLVIRDSYNNWGFPKGHLEEGEDAATAAEREIREETGLSDLVVHGPIREIDWHFRFRGRLIHKTCTFFLVESPSGEAVPQRDEGISDCRWLPLEEAQRAVSYANAREVLAEAGRMMAVLAEA